MKSKIFIISTFVLLSILFLNFNTVNADEINGYIESSDSDYNLINLSNISAVSTMAKEYLMNCEDITNSKYYSEDIFEYVVFKCAIKTGDDSKTHLYTAYFSSKPFIYGKGGYIQAQAPYVTFDFKYSATTIKRVGITNVTTTKNIISITSGTRVYSDFSIYDENNELYKLYATYFNWNFHGVIDFDGLPYIKTYIQEYPDYYLVTAAPFDVSYPYTFSYFINDTEYILEERADHLITNNFKVSKNIDDITLICRHDLNKVQKTFSLTLHFERSTTNRKPYLSVNYINSYTKEQLLSVNAKFSNYEYLEGCHSLGLKCHNLESDYKIYWSIDGELYTDNIHLINYINYSNKDYLPVYIPVGSVYELHNFDKPENIYFYITDKDGNKIYRHIFNTSSNTFTYNYYGSGISSGSSSNSGSSNVDYTGAFGYIGDIDGIDFDNFDVNNGITSLKSMFDSIKSVFQTISYILFGFLPSWITVPLSSLLVIIIVLTIIKLVRG